MREAAEAPVVDWRSWAALALLIAFWGSSFLFVSLALESFSPFFVTGARLAMAAAVVGVVARAVSGPFPAERRFWLWCAPVGICAVAAPFSLYSWAQEVTPSGLIAIYISATPLYVLVLSHFLTDEKMTTQGALGFGVGFCGVILLIGPQALLALGAGGGFWRELAALGAGCSFAAGAILVRLMPRFDPLHATAGALIVAALLYAPLTMMTAPVADLAAISTRAISAVAVLGLAQTGVAQITRYLLIKRSGAIFASQASYLVPVWAVCLGWIFLGETLTPTDLGGFALVLAGLATAQLKRGARG